MTTTLHIKNMVCSRCIRVVREELTSLGLNVQNVTLGEVVVDGDHLDRTILKERLHANGFELLETDAAKLVEIIKTLIIDLVQSEDLSEMHENLSDIITKRVGRDVGRDYATLSHLFSSVEAVTIERYFILQKIERAKELLTYGERTASEISYSLGYSSPAHLSRQFKQETGFTPSEFKRSRAYQHRIPLEEIGARSSFSNILKQATETEAE